MASTETMKWNLLYLILITVVMVMERIDGSRDGLLSSYHRGVFRDGSGLALSQMVVSNESGTYFVYVGGMSRLYQLNMDLTLRNQESTVPEIPDPCNLCAPKCVPCEDPCLYETKILEIAPAPIGKLVQCGGQDGRCEYRDLIDLSTEFGYTCTFQPVVNEGLSVGIVARRNRTLTRTEKHEFFMYVATSIVVPGSTRIPQPIVQSEFVHGSENPQFAFEYSRTIDEVYSAVDYIQGISWENYNFFIVHSGSEHSKLGRICSDNSEDNLGAYSEIILSCPSYSILQSANIDVNDILYGVFTNGTHSALCSYNMSDIQEKFVDTTCGCVIDSPVCNGQGTGISYLTLTMNVDSLCTPRSGTGQTRQSIKENYQCGDGSQVERFRYAQATDDLMGKLLGEGFPGNHSSIVTLNMDPTSSSNETVALVTTSSASAATLSKIHVKPDGTGRLYEMVDLEVESEVLTDVYINQESEELFILTNNEILKLAVVNCSQYTSCAECIGPTTDNGDPFCGWCTLEAKCSRSSECNNPDSDSSIWLQYNQDCIAINDLDPPSQGLDSAPLTVSFNVSQLPYPESNSEYSCQFNGIASSTSRTGSSFSCMTPAIDDRPTLPDGQDYVTMSLGIFASTTDNIIVKADFPFFMCSAIGSCSECVSSAWGCDWCVYESLCTLNGASACSNADEVVGNKEESCPRLEKLSTEILIPVGLSRTIYLTGSNLPTTNGVSYRCILSNMTDGSLLRRVDVDYFNSTSVQCEATVYNLASPSTLEEQVTIHVEYTSDVSSGYQLLDSEDNSVTLFQCSANGMSCRSCVTTTVRAQLGCGWCVESSSGACQVDAPDEQCTGNFFQRGSSEECPAPSISGIFPSAGPLEGNTTLTISGTNLAAEFNETSNITVAGIECSLYDFEPGLSVDCITGSSGNETRSGTVIVVFDFGTAESDDSFIYRNPVVYDFAPKTGIVSGGTEINITGQDLDTGRNIQVSVGDADCIMMEERPSSELIQCITSPLPDTSEMDNVSVIVTFDGTRKEVPGKYRFISDPTIEDYSPKETIMSGGITVTVTGSGFSIVQSAIMELTIGDEVIMEECSVNSDVEIQCLTPDLQNYTSSTSASLRKRRQATDVETAFVLDGFRYNPSESLTLYPDPVYDVLGGEYPITNPGGTEMFEGVNLNVPAEKTEDFVTVCFGKGECDVTEVTATRLSCLSPTEVPEGGVCKGDNADLPDVLNIVVFHGENLRQYLGTARYSTDSNLPQIVGGAVGGVVFLCIIVFLVFVCVGHRNYKAQIKHTEMEMENLMQHSRRQVMEGFFIDQEMTDTEEQLRGLGMPFVSNHDYMKSMLFFGLDVKPATTDPEIPSDMEQRAMLEFSKLLSNKNFLITIIHTLDNCKQITTVKKANIASLLTVVLVMERKFRYFTDVLVTLMSETISDAAERQRIKQLFKRTLTLEDKMLNNWIALAMFQSIKGYVGQPLYMLYQAIKIQCEKGPVDAVTGKSFFSLNFDNLLTEEVDFEELTLNVDSEIGQEPVKVLNVDTITQVKEKILDAMYRKKHTKYQRSAREVDLVIRSGQAGELVISDYDTSTQPSMGWCPINTLLHYGIQSGTQVALTDKKDMPNAMPVPMNDGANNLFNDTTRKSVRVTGHHEYNSHDLEKGPKDLKYYHLVQTEDSEEQVEETQEGFCGRMQRVLCFKGTQGKRKIREIYLQRLVSVKQSINNFVAQALDAMFTIREDSYVNNVNNIPFALRFLFNFFDEEASRYDDNVTAATWKNNILPLRFWSTILAHPSFIFNMRQSRTADSSVVVLNQMLDNACKGVVPTLKMNASPSRLLFNKELPDYISLLSSYYHNIQQTPTLEETELREECTRIDEEFSGLFSRLTTLKQLYECIRPHETLLVKALQEDDECHAARFADSLQRVGNTLDQPAD